MYVHIIVSYRIVSQRHVCCWYIWICRYYFFISCSSCLKIQKWKIIIIYTTATTKKHQTISFSVHTRYNVCVFLYYFALFITDRIIENMYMKAYGNWLGWVAMWMWCLGTPYVPLYPESSCGCRRRIYLGTAGWGWVRYCVCLFVCKKYFKRKMWKKRVLYVNSKEICGIY